MNDEQEYNKVIYIGDSCCACPFYHSYQPEDSFDIRERCGLLGKEIDTEGIRIYRKECSYKKVTIE